MRIGFRRWLARRYSGRTRSRWFCVSASSPRQGYKAQRSADQHAGRKIIFSYISTNGSPDRVSVDLNFLFRLPLTGTTKLTMWQPGKAELQRVTVVGIEELCAGKFCALLSRSLPRDLFDMMFLPEIAGDLWKTSRLRKILIGVSAILDHPLSSYGRERLDRVTDQAIDQQLAPMLTRGDPPPAKDLKTKVWAIVEPLLTLEPAEREYVERVQLGELRPELLFPDDEILADRLRRHPALRWKSENARRHLATQKRTAGGRKRTKER
jgi:hypothetical protein